MRFRQMEIAVCAVLFPIFKFIIAHETDTDLHREFDLVRRGEDLPEYEAYHAWNHASFLGVVDGRPKHGMRLTRTGLPIGKDSAIEAFHNTFAHGPDSPIED